MNGELRLDRALEDRPGLERDVRKRAGNRCEGWIDDWRMRDSAQRCTARGDVLDLYLGFEAWLSDDPITARGIGLFCEACYDRSETAEASAHRDFLLSKDD